MCPAYPPYLHDVPVGWSPSADSHIVQADDHVPHNIVCLNPTTNLILISRRGYSRDVLVKASKASGAGLHSLYRTASRVLCRSVNGEDRCALGGAPTTETVLEPWVWKLISTTQGGHGRGRRCCGNGRRNGSGRGRSNCRSLSSRFRRSDGGSRGSRDG